MGAQRELAEMTVPELTQALGSRTRALETVQWLWKLRAAPPELPALLDGVSHRVWRPFREAARLSLPRIDERQVSEDGTTRYVLGFGATRVETVRIPSSTRSTVCVSSQAGCTRHCRFCATATLGFSRQLSAAEMVAQFFTARLEAPPHAPARNVVFMGMGEPMDNLDAVLRAIEVLTQSPAPQLRAEQITVSTSGVVPGMRRFLRESKASLALSLNATTDEVREQLMPQNRTWPIAALIEVLEEEAAVHPRREHFIEYVLFEGVNDTPEDADRLVRLLERVPSRVNLIPHNPFPQSPYRPPSEAALIAFQRRVVRQGKLCLVRWPRGREIAAACGQLALQTG
jgi:23S rRNA (adenine2503-C2)-methyltransferase